jgi:hypothetical protein
LSGSGDDADGYASSCDEEEIEERRKNSYNEETGEYDELSDTEPDNERYSPMNCFGCMWGHPDQSALNGDKVNECLKMIDDGYGTIHNLCLARQVHQFFKKEIYGKVASVPMWRTMCIKHHIENHTLEPRIFLGEMIRKSRDEYNELRDKVNKSITLSDGTRVNVVDDKTHRCLSSTVKNILELYKTSPKTMNFYNKNCTIDLEKAGKLINPNKTWEYKQK